MPRQIQQRMLQCWFALQRLIVHTLRSWRFCWTIFVDLLPSKWWFFASGFLPPAEHRQNIGRKDGQMQVRDPPGLKPWFFSGKWSEISWRNFDPNHKMLQRSLYEPHGSQICGEPYLSSARTPSSVAVHHWLRTWAEIEGLEKDGKEILLISADNLIIDLICALNEYELYGIKESRNRLFANPMSCPFRFLVSSRAQGQLQNLHW